MRLTMIVGGMLLAAAITARAQTQAPASGASAEKVERGKKAFVTYLCYSCHGYAAHGGTDTGPRIDANKFTVEAFTRFVRKPPSMPPYAAKHLPDAVLDDIYAYLKSIPPPQDPKTIPLLKD
jgi:mono/diheme cytochrome c family protein